MSNRTPAPHFYMQQMRRPDSRMHLLMAGEGGGGSGNNAWWAEDGDELVDAPRRVERLDITYARASKQARLHSALAALPIEWRLVGLCLVLLMTMLVARCDSVPDCGSAFDAWCDLCS